jgi:predicted dienelactone hydrolase
MADAPYPLVVFSPGLTGWRQAYAYLAEHLASYGFVVITPDHHGETFEAFWEGAIGRQLEVNRSITFADELTADGGALAEVIDTERIATTGHSSGGWTALTGGGAQMNFSWCTAHPDLVAQNPITDCNQFPAHQEELAAMAGLDSVPTGMWPAMNDPRVDAVIAMAPDGDIWGENYEGVAALTVPTMVMGGSGDTTNIPEITSYPIYEHLGSVNKAFVVFENADHMMFGTSCPNSPWLVEAGLSWVCADAVWDMDRAHDLTNHFATAFLLDVLKGDEDAAAALAPENVQFPGVQYEATGF